MSTKDVGYGATTASHEPGTEHKRPDPKEQKEAAGQGTPIERGDRGDATKEEGTKQGDR